jgi:hypothetical protein
MTITKEQRDESEHRLLAELQVEAFITLLQKRYGLKPEAIPEILDDMRWLREHRNGINRVSWSVALGILAIALSGVMHALWEGIKASAGK